MPSSCSSPATPQATSACGSAGSGRRLALPAGLRRVLAAGAEGRVALPAHGLGLDEVRALAAARVRRRPGPSPRATAVTSLPSTISAAMPKPRARSAMSGRGLAELGRHADREAVVRADEDQRQLPQLGHVQRLEELALARGAVAEVDRDDLVRCRAAAPRARRRRPSGCGPPRWRWSRERPTLGSERCIDPPLPLQMPPSRVISSPIIADGVDALGERLAVPAVGGEHLVVGAQLRRWCRPGSPPGRCRGGWSRG